METDPEFEKRTEQLFGLGLFKAQVDAAYEKAKDGDTDGAFFASTQALRTAAILLTEREVLDHANVGAPANT